MVSSSDMKLGVKDVLADLILLAKQRDIITDEQACRFIIELHVENNTMLKYNKDDVKTYPATSGIYLVQNEQYKLLYAAWDGFISEFRQHNNNIKYYYSYPVPKEIKMQII